MQNRRIPEQVAVEALFVRLDTTIRDVIRVIDRSGKVSLALIVDEEKRLLNTVTDGDIRRAIMAGVDLSSPASVLLPLKAPLPQSKPITAAADAAPDELLNLMNEKGVRQVVLLGASGEIANVALLRDLVPQKQVPMRAMIMAGGFGKRLRPLTDDTPKPMLPVGEKPLMERTVERLHDAGIRQILVATHYMPEKIIDHFGGGQRWDVSINYVQEDQPLGTGGALSLIERPTEPMLVINGDILTEVDFRAMLAFHEESKADMTVGVRHYGFRIPYGVVECDGPIVHGVSEKPQLNFFVNAGIYLLSPSVFDFIGKSGRFHLTDVIRWLLDAGRKVVSFPIIEFWLDIGQHDDYRSAQETLGGHAPRTCKTD